MKHKHIGFLIILAASILGSCSDPSGSITGGEGSNNLFAVIAIKDEVLLRTEADRRFYRRKDHLKVFGAEINDSNLRLKIVNDPLSVQTPVVDIDLNVFGYYEFSQPGQYLLRGTYNGKQDEYPITVLDRDPSGGGGSTGIEMEWLP